mmetsp:Transcript_23162/g.58799  ORF Transcript_23162/g.58799 Transcript_23162/m.58799 type:complete len:179 (+) Transcript_23162:414-950(+)
MAQSEKLRLSPAPAIAAVMGRLLVPRLAALSNRKGVHPLVDVYLTLCSQSTVVLSNVPGPRQRLKLPGALCHVNKESFEVTALRFYGVGHAGVYCGLLSCAGEVHLSLSSDPAVELEPARLAHIFADAVSSLHGAAAMLTVVTPRPPVSLTDLLIVVALRGVGWVALAACAALACYVL